MWNILGVRLAGSVRRVCDSLDLWAMGSSPMLGAEMTYIFWSLSWLTACRVNRVGDRRERSQVLTWVARTIFWDIKATSWREDQNASLWYPVDIQVEMSSRQPDVKTWIMGETWEWKVEWTAGQKTEESPNQGSDPLEKRPTGGVKGHSLLRGWGHGDHKGSKTHRLAKSYWPHRSFHLHR